MLFDQVKENIKEAQKKQKEVYDRKHSNPPKYADGTIVLKKDFLRKKRKGGCLDHRWIGPYKVVKDMGKGFYSIQSIANGKKLARIHGIHLKPYNTPAEAPQSDEQDPLNDSLLAQGHESSHNSHLSNVSSSSASSISKAGMVNNEAGMVDNEAGMVDNKAGMVDNELGMVDNKAGMVNNEAGMVNNKLGMVDNEDEVSSQDGHIKCYSVKSPSIDKSMLQQSIASPQAYEPADLSNNECDNAFVASDLNNHCDSSEMHNSTNRDQFICSALFEGYGYFPIFVPIYPKTLLEVSPIKYTPAQSNENRGMYKWILHV